MHIIIHVLPPHNIELINSKFRSFTSKKLINFIKEFQVNKLASFISSMTDRNFQIWKSNVMCVEIASEKFLDQKMDYIHNNPVNAKLVMDPIDYKWSSANFYENGDKGEFEFLDNNYFEE